MKVPRLESTTAFPIIPGYGEKEHGDGPVGPGNPRSLHWEGGEVQNILWTADQKFVYINGNDGSTQELAIWREAADGSSAAEKLAGGGAG